MARPVAHRGWISVAAGSLLRCPECHASASAQSSQRAVDNVIDVVPEGHGVDRRQVSPSGEESFCREFRRDDRTKLCDAPAIARDRDPLATRDAIDDITPV